MLEKKAVEQGDIRFFELAALDVNVVPQPRRSLCVELRDFIISADDVPQQVQKATTHWSQWIDYWAVDWDFKGDTFHNQWQSYRTKKQPKLELHAQHAYEASGTYTVVIKVIDILENDTTKSVGGDALRWPGPGPERGSRMVRCSSARCRWGRPRLPACPRSRRP